MWETLVWRAWLNTSSEGSWKERLWEFPAPSSVSAFLSGCSGLLEIKFCHSHMWLETLGADLLPCKGETAASLGEAAGKRWAEHPFHLSAAGPARARPSVLLCHCSLHTPPGLAGIHIPLTGFLHMVFQLFFGPKLLGITQGCFSKESFPWQERDPTDAL